MRGAAAQAAAGQERAAPRVRAGRPARAEPRAAAGMPRRRRHDRDGWVRAGNGRHATGTGGSHTGGTTTGTGGSTGTGGTATGGSTAAAAARAPAGSGRTRAERQRRAAAAPAPAVEAAAARPARPGTGGRRPGYGRLGHGRDREARLRRARRIEGFGFNTALSSTTPDWATFYGTGTNGLGLSIVRVAMQSNGSLSGRAPAEQLQREGHRVALDRARQLQGQQQHAEGRAPATRAVTTRGRRRSPTSPRTTSSTRWGRRTSPTLRRVGPPSVHPATATTTRWSSRPTRWWLSSRCWDRSSRAAGVKLIAPEPSEWIHLWSNASATGSTVAGHPNSSDPLKCGCFSNTPTTTGCASTCATGDGYDYGHFLAKDATAWGLIDILGTHEYDSQKAEAWPADVDGGKRSKTI